MDFKSELEAYRFIMDIETYVFESTPVPFSNKVIVDKDVMYDYLDRLRSRLPKEMKECKRLIEKRQREENSCEYKQVNSTNKPTEKNDAQVKEEIDNTINNKMVQDTHKECEEMLKGAQEQAQAIINDAYLKAEKIMVLLEEQIDEKIKEVKNGRQEIADVIKKIAASN
ncbi:MAG: hypothetical protein ACOYJ1_06795 [Peptococcales bacterium]|jgi:hypothetical protein